MTINIFLNILDKLIIIIAFSFISKVLITTNLFPTILSIKENISVKKITIIWFIIGFFCSGFFSDMTDAVMLFPIAFAFTKSFEKEDKEHILLSLVLGIGTGGDLTAFGANDNLMAISLLQTNGIQLTYLEWTKWMITPTLIMGLLIGCFVYHKASDNYIQNIKKEYVKHPLRIVLTIILITLAFIIKSWQLLIITALIILFITKDFKELIKLPYKAMLMWTVAFSIGNFIDFGLKTSNITFPNLNMIAIIFILVITTNFITNSSLTAISLPIILIMFPNNTLIAMCAIKAISTAYITILGNSCYAVANGYGVTQSVLLKNGVIATIIGLIVQIIYFEILSMI